MNRYIPEDQYLLKDVKLNDPPKELKYDLRNLVRQTPNKKFLGLFKFNTWFYMYLSSQKKISRFDSFFMKNFGERPVFLDTMLMQGSESQMEDFLLNKGYFDAEVDMKIVRSRKKAKVIFSYTELNANYIDKVLFGADDDRVFDLIIKPENLKRSHLKTGEIFDSDKLIAERERLAKLLNTNGYYRFSKYFIYFDVDTTYSELNKTNVTVFVRDFNDTTRHNVYIIDEIVIDPYYSLNDTTQKKRKEYAGLIFLNDENRKISEDLFKRNISFRENELFNITKVNQTINQLSDIQLYKFIDVGFIESDTISKDTLKIRAEIRLTPEEKYVWEYGAELNTTEETKELTATSNRYYGLAGNLSFRDRNLFRSAVQWAFKVRGAFDIQSTNIENEQVFGNYQFELNNSLYFPSAFLPSKMLRDDPGFISKTAVNLSYIIENNQDFRRTTASSGIIYQFTSEKVKIFFTPFEFNLVETDLQPFFQATIDEYDDPLLKSVFETHVITPIKSSIIYATETKARKRVKVRFGIENAGLLPWLYNDIRTKSLTDINTVNDEYKIMGVPFFQYFRTDLEFTFHQFLFAYKNSFNYRVDLGVGIPYENSQVMPIEKLYYLGGANSMRAWPLRGLGPGSYYDSSDIRFNQSGNLKFETNVEYRFDMVSLLKGALFVDIGNVWTLEEDENRPGSKLEFKNFFEELALGVGFGLRWDFVFFILRTDFAVPVREPSMPVGERWVLRQSQLNDINISVGIGYPF